MSTINTRIAQVHNGNYEINVKADDVAADKDQLFVRICDNSGNTIDVPAQYEKTQTNKFGPASDIWNVVVPEDALKNFDKDQLKCTSYLQVHGSTNKIWEGKDTQIAPARKDVQFEHGPELPEGQYSHYNTLQCQTESGKVELKEYSRRIMNSSKTLKTTTGLKEIAFEDKANKFGGADKLEMVIIPVVREEDFEQGALHAIREGQQLKGMNTITLTRQGNGTYIAKAEQEKTFTLNTQTSVYAGFNDKTDRTLIQGYEFAINNPADGSWDNPASGGNYRITR